MKRGLGFLALFALIGCTPLREPVNFKSQARHLLNQSRYEDAIALLAKELSRNEKDAEARTLLASAYAGSVGVNLIDAFGSLETLLFREPLLDASNDDVANRGESRNPPGVSPEEAAKLRDVRKFEAEFVKALSALHEWSSFVFGLPQIPPEKQGRVLKAIDVLGGVDTPHTREYRAARLYEAVLNLVQFVSLFREAMPDRQTLRQSPIEMFCGMDLIRVAENLQRMSRYLSDAMASALKAKGDQKGNGHKVLEKASAGVGKAHAFLAENRGAFSAAALGHGVLKNEICAP